MLEGHASHIVVATLVSTLLAQAERNSETCHGRLKYGTTNPDLWLAYGLFALFFPNVSKRRGTKHFPGHEFVGMAIFLLAICAAETGLVNNSMTLEWSWGTERLIVNFIGLLIFLFWVCVSLSRILQRDSLMVSLIDDIGSAIDIGSVIADLESNGIALELQD
ncbi:hypothetical protein TIFTF001_007597 [Ficus carica]|uniref:Cytochrome b561 domain-containing protein n=1 Tax=Ficus carica TaxID=3494 RepID=A0AA88CZT5_FICCA|nr:hypothetical protein TIFTF001_007597 [Ficus carica]